MFYKLIKLASMYIPLSFSKVENRRILLYVDNFASSILVCIFHLRASVHIFIVTSIWRAMNKSVRLIAVPRLFLHLLGMVFGKKKFAPRWLEPLQINFVWAKSKLNLTPRYTSEQGIEATVNIFLEDKLGNNFDSLL